MTRRKSLYDRKWRAARKIFLQLNPSCAYCHEPATVVDHIQPHRQDTRRFWDRNNWQPLCKRCHDADKARIENGKDIQVAGADGMPLNPNHPWNRGNPLSFGEQKTVDRPHRFVPGSGRS